MEIKRNVLLAPYTTFRIGGPADYFCVVKTQAELVQALKLARAEKLPFFVLGGGSNILVSDAGFRGLAIKNEILGIEFGGKGGRRVAASGGEDWDYLVSLTVDKDLSGLENLSAIPGSVGAAPIQNIGAYGAELKDTLSAVEAIDSETLKIKKFSAAECHLKYRDSFFKTKTGRRFVITRTILTLDKNKPNIAYKDLSLYFKNFKNSKNRKAPTLADVRLAVAEIRARKLPDTSTLGTAGSFFKNPVMSVVEFRKLAMHYPALPSYKVGRSKVKVPLAWILDEVLKLRGARRGHVGAYDKQPLSIVNFGGGTAAEVRSFADEIIKLVREKTGLKPELEVELIGSDLVE